MRISDWSSDVCSSDLVGQGRGRVEQGVELCLERRVAAEMIDQAVDIMLVEEGRLPAVRFGIIAPFLDVVAGLDGVIIIRPAAVPEARAREARCGVDDDELFLRALAQRRGGFMGSQCCGEVTHGPSSIGDRKSARYGAG